VTSVQTQTRQCFPRIPLPHFVALISSGDNEEPMLNIDDAVVYSDPESILCC